MLFDQSLALVFRIIMIGDIEKKKKYVNCMIAIFAIGFSQHTVSKFDLCVSCQSLLCKYI